jgi:NTE family protein
VPDLKAEPEAGSREPEAESVRALTDSARPGHRVAVVIGSGSVKCAAALGLMRVLQREGIGIDLVVGCSGGSLYAAVIALGFDAETSEEMTRRLWTREVTRKRNRRAVLSVLLPRLFRFDERFGLVDDRLILERLQTAFGERTFAETKVPLYLTATDFHTGGQVVFSSGRIVDAIRASISIPYVFRPWKVADRYLIDGFLSDPMPVGVAIREGADVIVTMGFESPYQQRVTSLLRFAFQLSSIMSNNILRANYAFHNLAHHNEIIPIIPQFRERIQLFDTDKIPYVIEEGERAAERQVPYLRRLLAAGRDG